MKGTWNGTVLLATKAEREGDGSNRRWGKEKDRRRSHEAGFDHHPVKPVDPQALMKCWQDCMVLQNNQTLNPKRL